MERLKACASMPGSKFIFSIRHLSSLLGHLVNKILNDWMDYLRLPYRAASDDCPDLAPLPDKNPILHERIMIPRMCGLVGNPGQSPYMSISWPFLMPQYSRKQSLAMSPRTSGLRGSWVSWYRLQTDWQCWMSQGRISYCVSRIPVPNPGHSSVSFPGHCPYKKTLASFWPDPFGLTYVEFQ